MTKLPQDVKYLRFVVHPILQALRVNINVSAHPHGCCSIIIERLPDKSVPLRNTLFQRPLRTFLHMGFPTFWTFCNISIAANEEEEKYWLFTGPLNAFCTTTNGTWRYKWLNIREAIVTGKPMLASHRLLSFDILPCRFRIPLIALNIMTSLCNFRFGLLFFLLPNSYTGVLLHP